MNTITDRINKIIADSGLNQSEVARKVGTSPQAIRKWQSGESTGIKGENLIQLAKIGRTSMEWIQAGRHGKVQAPDNANVEIIEPSQKVPVIDMVAAGGWAETVVDPYPIDEVEDWQECPVPHDENTFAVRINSESMMPKFEHGEIIFCDPNTQAENKDYVIAKISDENQATFKQLVMEDGQKMLKAINPNWPVKYIPINGNCHIVGKVIARLEKF